MNLYFYVSKILSPFFLFSNILIFFLIFSLIFRKKLKIFFYIYLIFFFMISIYPIGKILEHRFLKKDYYNKEMIKDFDAILVLGGDERRIIYAVDLIKKYNNVKLIFTGGGGYLVQNKISNENKSFKKRIENLLNDDEYFVLKESRNTVENLLSFKEFNVKHDFKKVVILTSPSHMKRSLIISNKIGLNLHPYYWKVTRRNFSFINFYQTFSFFENISSFDVLFREILGILSLNFI